MPRKHRITPPLRRISSGSTARHEVFASGRVPYVNSGYVSDVFPDHSGNYPENPTDTAPVIQLDFTRNITFGKLEIDIGESSGINQFYIVARRDTTHRRHHPVNNGHAKIYFRHMGKRKTVF